MKKLLLPLLILAVAMIYSCDRQPPQNAEKEQQVAERRSERSDNTDRPLSQDDRAALRTAAEENPEELNSILKAQFEDLALSENDKAKVNAAIDGEDFVNMNKEERKNAFRRIAQMYNSLSHDTNKSAPEAPETDASDTPQEAPSTSNGPTATEWLNNSLSGIEYTADQQAQIDAFKAKYDFDNLPENGDKLNTARTIMSEIARNILTEDQKIVLRNRLKKDRHEGHNH